ncbi:hypothetical protein MKW94_025826 [Papaver nudicaule]|uniref:Myb/SANT-like domain-containing protein n=1 Tax=Papaver nudicaule TaxID=74823 RepID=A0AA41RYV4_PAPNU|nr:hypothetical protein [Papaver nudicaule]
MKKKKRRAPKVNVSAHWTDDMEKELCELLIEQMVSGSIPGNAATWTLVKNEFNRKMEKHLTVPQIKSRYYMLRSRYKEILRFMSSGGLIWDTDEKKILKNPDEACYRTLSCPIFEDLCVLFGDVPAENIDVETPNLPSKKHRSSGFHGEVEVEFAVSLEGVSIRSMMAALEKFQVFMLLEPGLQKVLGHRF